MKAGERGSARPPIAPPLLALIGSCVSGGLCFAFTVDDAFIVARFAQHIASGAGYVMNVGERAADGVTGPLWLVPLVLMRSLGFDPIAVAKLVGLACMASSVWIVTRRVGTRATGGVMTWVAAVLLATQPTLASWSVGGLETGAVTLAATVLASTAMPGGRPATWAIALAGAAVPWLRPELSPMAAVLLLHHARAEPTRGVRVALAALMIGALVLPFRWSLFGHLLPLSAAAKPASIAAGLEYAARSVVVTTALGGIALTALGARSGRRGDRVLGLALLAHVAAVVVAGGDWMPGFRLLAPVLPIYGYLVAVGFARLRVSRLSWRRWAAWVLLAPTLGVPLVDLALRVDGARETAHSRATVGEQLVAELREHATRVALVDVGFLAYRSGVGVFDLGGVTDAAVAFAPGGHLDKHIDERLLRERAPDAILLHSRSAPQVGDDGELLGFDGYAVERRVAQMPWVRQHFTVASVHDYAPGYRYVLLLRRQ